MSGSQLTEEWQFYIVLKYMLIFSKNVFYKLVIPQQEVIRILEGMKYPDTVCNSQQSVY